MINLPVSSAQLADFLPDTQAIHPQLLPPPAQHNHQSWSSSTLYFSFSRASPVVFIMYAAFRSLLSRPKPQSPAALPDDLSPAPPRKEQ